jgi:Xaa-Pro aminopeptidase
MDAFRAMIESSGNWLKGAGILSGPIGLEFAWLTVDQYRNCEGVISGYEFSDVTGRITELRMIKEGDEQIELRHAAELTVTAARRAAGEFRPGATESLIKSVMEQTAFVDGGRMWPEAAIETDINVVSGPKMNRAHDFATGRAINAGEAALFFEAVACNGYWANLARTVIIPGASGPDPRVKLLQVIEDAHRAALDAMGPGLTLRHAGRVADKILSKRGLHQSTPMFRGVGLTFYERPGLGDLDDPLKPGMSLSVNLYVNHGGTTLGRSDTVLITEKVADVLTASMP